MPRKSARQLTPTKSHAECGQTPSFRSLDVTDSPEHDGYVYILPDGLFAAVVSTIGVKLPRTATGRDEAALDEAVGSPFVIGYWRRMPLRYQFLTAKLSQGAVETNGYSDQNTTTFVRPFQLRHLYSCWHQLHVFQGYLGWLLTNPQFIQEHDALLEQHLTSFRRWGVHRDRTNATPSMAAQLFGQQQDYPGSDPAWREFESMKEAFCFRWRLAGLAGPDLPLPIGAQVDQDVPITYFVRGIEQTGLFLLPDILPIPSRDQIRKSIDDARRSTNGSNHLAGWFKIIRLGNQAKNQIDRFARVFIVQHYWRTLKSRHAEALSRNTGKLELAFAQWLEVSEETIHQDRLMIARRLGRNWSIRKHAS